MIAATMWAIHWPGVFGVLRFKHGRLLSDRHFVPNEKHLRGFVPQVQWNQPFRRRTLPLERERCKIGRRELPRSPQPEGHDVGNPLARRFRSAQVKHPEMVAPARFRLSALPAK